LSRVRPIRLPLVLTLAAAGGAAGALALTGSEHAPLPAPTAHAGDAPAAPLTYDPRVSLAPLVKTLGPTVVHLEVEKEVASPLGMIDPRMHPFLRMPEGFDAPQTRSGEGSGFIISEDGLVLTNNHVVDGADKVTVTLDDERTFEATVLGTDPRTDIALVKLEGASGLPTATLGSSDGLEVGDWVVAIGNPYGLDHSVSTGIVSGKGRDIGAGPYDAFLQTDASINPGNSGGPLFNLKGEVVGINTAIIGQGIGFAVPIDMVAGIVDELREDGRVARGWMGVGLRPLDEALGEQLGVPAGGGVVLGQIYPGTPAAEAGLRAGDVLTSLDGEPVDDSAAVVRAIGTRKPGEVVKLGVLRDGKSKTVKVALGDRPEEGDLRAGRWRSSPEPEAGRGGALSDLGLAAKSARSLGMRGDDAQGVVITRVAQGSPAAGQLRAGDRVLTVDGERVRDPDDLGRALSEAGDRALLVVDRGEAQVLVDLSLTDD
jgi:serine protease Do